MNYPSLAPDTQIAIGSANKAKVQAVRRAMTKFYGPAAQHTTLHSHSTESGVSEQPFGSEEIIRGAKNRARHALQLTQQAGHDHNLAIGLECGILSLPGETEDHLYNLSVAAITVGEDDYLGLSALFPIPMRLIAYLRQGYNLVEAALQAGITQDPNIGSGKGLAPLLTYGQMERTDYLEMAVYHALVHHHNGH
ncbi:MAG: inosine/xanthosine triphosphatase [Zetaproteobacteria bacterium]|nr:inosine/xanthosine triphosphatase [Zetaproteobacteria bacterium]